MNSTRPSANATNGGALNVVLGIWLIISAFMWPHAPAEALNTWIVGIVITAVALIGFAVPAIRLANSVAAIWLFIGTLALPHVYRGTAWNNCIVAILVFVASLAAAGGMRPTLPRSAPH